MTIVLFFFLTTVFVVAILIFFYQEDLSVSGFMKAVMCIPSYMLYYMLRWIHYWLLRIPFSLLFYFGYVIHCTYLYGFSLSDMPSWVFSNFWETQGWLFFFGQFCFLVDCVFSWTGEMEWHKVIPMSIIHMPFCGIAIYVIFFGNPYINMHFVLSLLTLGLFDLLAMLYAVFWHYTGASRNILGLGKLAISKGSVYSGVDMILNLFFKLPKRGMLLYYRPWLWGYIPEYRDTSRLRSKGLPKLRSLYMLNELGVTKMDFSMKRFDGFVDEISFKQGGRDFSLLKEFLWRSLVLVYLFFVLFIFFYFCGVYPTGDDFIFPFWD